MAQFDVYANPNVAYRKEFPWVIDIQHELLSALRTRLAVPLAANASQPSGLPSRLFVQFPFQNQRYTLMPHMAAAVHASHFKNSQGNLAHYRSEIQAALDAVVAGV